MGIVLSLAGERADDRWTERTMVFEQNKVKSHNLSHLSFSPPEIKKVLEYSGNLFLHLI